MSRRAICALGLALLLEVPGCGGDEAPLEPASGIETRGAPFVLYLSPLGADSLSGLTPDEPLLTLTGAQTRLKQYKPVIDQDVEIRIRFVAAMPYLGQTVDWTHVSPDHTISFLPEDYRSIGVLGVAVGRPVFDGQGAEDWFFDLRHPEIGETGGRTNVRFYYLHIQGYVPGAIRFRGEWNGESGGSGWNGGNTVRGCCFSKLGNMRFASDSPGYGALDLVNSDGNVIANNRFEHIENRGEDGALIHAVYLAHNSEHNRVAGNSFTYVSGDPIRVRDCSNYNAVIGNSFRRAGNLAFISDWYAEGECRSWENEFRDNASLGFGYSGRRLAYCWLAFDNYDEGSNCPIGESRLHSSGNDWLICP
jgi:hypothetical protein